VPATHCLPTGSLQTAELPVCNISLGTSTAYIPTGGVGHGNIRGIVVYLGGLDVQYNSGAAIPCVIPPDGTVAGLELFGTTFKNSLVADGWIVLAVPANEWFYNGYGSQGVYNAINADAGNGSNYLKGTIHWWTHVMEFCYMTYPGMPLVPFGISWGGWQTLQVAGAMPKSILAFGCHCPATIVRNIASIFSVTANFGLTNTTGADIQSNLLASVTGPPGIIGFGTNDEAVGYTGTSQVSSGFTPTAAASVTSLPLVSTTGYIFSVSVTVPTTGGAGYATYNMSGPPSGGSLQGMTLVSGSGTVQPNSVVTQSTTSALIAASPANIVGNSTADTHEFTLADANFYSGTWFVNTVDPLAPKLF
jgi:hypothetical protein